MPDFQTGDWIGGDYRVIAIFGGAGRSGMGVVYLVEDRERLRPFVLKTFQHEHDDASRRIFVAEAKAWIAAGAHPNIVQAFWVREIAGCLYVAAEFVSPDELGRNSLSHFLSSTPLPLEVTLRWAAQFCYGMEYARRRGVLAHRDIKPDNLMVDTQYSLKITDFGISKSVDPAALSTDRKWWNAWRKQEPQTVGRTDVGTRMGTLYYMPPEQLTDAHRADHRSDIYSFGIVMYQMASGNAYPYAIDPKRQDVADQIRHAHLSQSPRRIDSVLMPVIEKCLAKTQDARYSNYNDLLRHLDRIARSSGMALPSEQVSDRSEEEIYARAQSYVSLGDPGRALAAIDEYVGKYPKNSCGWTEKGKIHYQMGDYEAGVAATRHSLALDPSNTHAWNNLGIGLSHVGAELSLIRHAYDNALRLDPGNAVALSNVVGPLVQGGLSNEAAEALASAIRLAPHKQLYIDKAESLLRECISARAYRASHQLLMAWTEARPEEVRAWHNRGLLAIQIDDSTEAIDCFEKVRSLTPGDDFAVVQLAKLYFQAERGKQCIEACNELIQRGKEVLLAVTLKARAANFMGAYPQAVALLKSYIASSPKADALWVVLAEIHEYRDELTAAREALEVAKSLLLESGGAAKTDNLAVVNSRIKAIDQRLQVADGSRAEGLLHEQVSREKAIEVACKALRDQGNDLFEQFERVIRATDDPPQGMYRTWADEPAWYIWFPPKSAGLASSRVVVVSKQSGRVIGYSSANDEG